MAAQPATSTAVRPLEPSDFEALVALYPPEWRFAGSSAQEDAAQARMDCASLVGSCNLRLVAEVPGPDGAPQVAGMLLARVAGIPAPAPEDGALWQDLESAARAELEAAATPSTRRILLYIDQLADRAALLEKAAGEARGEDNELELFVVGPAARGKGSGSALIGAFERTLAEQNAASYWLQTDTRCTWQWYERHGYARVADVALGAEYPMPDAVACDPEEPPHVFMYRKDLGSKDATACGGAV